MSALTEKQGEFTFLIGKLIHYAVEQGYRLRFGDAWRNTTWYACPHCSESISYQMLLVASGVSWKMDSLHADRLAVDFVVERLDGVPMTDPDWLKLGEFWEDHAGTDADWGGRYGVTKDLYHVKVGKDPGHFGLKK